MEVERIDCPFYNMIGACRHEDKCQRIHNKPSESLTVLIKNLFFDYPEKIETGEQNNYINEMSYTGSENEIVESKPVYDDDTEIFYEEIFLELTKFGEIDEIMFSRNACNHLKGNVYVKYFEKKDALNCLVHLTNRYYNRIKLLPEFSSVTDFSKSQCKQYIDGECKRGDYCNYIHPLLISKAFRRSLFRQMYKCHPEYQHKSRLISTSKQSAANSANDDRSEVQNGDQESKNQQSQLESEEPTMQTTNISKLETEEENQLQQQQEVQIQQQLTTITLNETKEKVTQIMEDNQMQEQKHQNHSDDEITQISDRIQRSI